MTLLLMLLACAPEPVGFTTVRDEVLIPGCGFGSCHGQGAGGLTLDEQGAYDALVDAESEGSPGDVRVVPGDPAASYLVWKLQGDERIEGDPMPPPNGGIRPENLELIRQWIADGALE